MHLFVKNSYKLRRKSFKYLALLLALIYCLKFYWLHPIIGNSYQILSIIPLILIVNYYGLKIALLVQIIFLINRYFAFKYLNIDITTFTDSAQIIGTSANLCVLMVINYIKLISKKLRNTKNYLEENQIALTKSNKRLIKLNSELKNAKEELNKKNSELLNLTNLLRNKEQRLNTLIRNQGEGFGITDLNENFIFANPAACKIFNLNNEELIGKNLRDFFDGEEWEKIAQQTKKRIKGKSNTYQATIKLPNKKKKYLLVTASPDYDKNNNIIGTEAVFRDITKIKKKEKEIKEKNKKLNKYYTAIQQSSATILFTNTYGEIEYVNPQFSVLTGYSFKEVIGKNPRILSSGKTPKKTIKDLWETLNKGKTWQGEFINKKKDGTLFYEKAIITPILDEKNNISSYIAIKEDVTVLKKKEEELNQLNIELSNLLETSEHHKKVIENAHFQIQESINYASRIQRTILPDVILGKKFKEYFILYKPRDLVSGDFYWMKNINNNIVVVTADCTGHGVPGAFMSMLGIAFLNEIVNDSNYRSPGIILAELREKVKKLLKQTGKEDENKDGIDMTLYTIDRDSNQLFFAGAQRSLFIVRSINNQALNINGNNYKIINNSSSILYDIKGNKQPVGIHMLEKSFDTVQIKLADDDCLYSFSDGFADQFGGSLGRKFMTKNFKYLLLEICKKPLIEQKQILNQKFSEWIGTKHEQVDDILVLGIRV